MFQKGLKEREQYWRCKVLKSTTQDKPDEKVPFIKTNMYNCRFFPKQHWVRGGANTSIHLVIVSIFATITGKIDIIAICLNGLSPRPSLPSNAVVIFKI